MPVYTPKQGQYLAFIYYYTRLHGHPPAETDMQRYFRVSPPSVHQMIITLAEKGFITRVPGMARSIRVLLPPEQLPALDEIGAISKVSKQVREGLASFDAKYPSITAWVTSYGWIEVGADESSRSLVRALDEGGMVWEGKTTYLTLEALFADLEMNLAKRIKENG